MRSIRIRGIYSLIVLFIFIPLSEADVILHDTFEKDKLDVVAWAPSDANFVYVKDGVLVLDQKGSGTDWVGINTNPPPYKDCVIYYEWILAEYSGQGDCGGPLRKSFGTYTMRWGWGNTVNLVDSIAHPPLAAWQAFPGCSSPYPDTSKHFALKAMFKFPKITIHIFDMDESGKQIANWETKDDFYDSGVLGFECWKFGIVHVDNVVVATLDWEDKVFSDGFDPVTLNAGKAVESTDKLSSVWGKIKVQ